MHSPSILTPAPSRRTARLAGTGPAGLRSGLLLALAVMGIASLPLLSDLTWADIAQKAADQALAALQLVQAAFTILTL